MNNVFLVCLKRSLLLVTIAFAIVGIFSCSNHGAGNRSNDDTANMLRIDIGSEPPTLDPTLSEDTYSTRVAFDLFAGLVSSDQKNQIIPGMATSWNASSDGKTYTFHLRPNLKFSDGSPITASDFVYSWQRLVDPKTASPYSFYLEEVVNAKIITQGKLPVTSLGVDAPNDTTFVVHLNYPNSAFITKLALPNVFVVPQKVIAKYGDAWTKPENIVTSGAYILKEHVVNGYVLAEKNPYFYDANNVHIEKVKYLPLEDADAAIPSYKSGGVDMTFQSVPIDQYANLKQNYPNELHTVKQEGLYDYVFNMKNPELAKNKNLRQALSMAIDRQVLVNNVLREGQAPLYGLATLTINQGTYQDLRYDWSSWSRDKQIAEAQRLYKAAGYDEAHPFNATVLYNSNDLHKKMALAIAFMWKQVLGVNINVQNQEWKTFLQVKHNGDFQIGRDGWIADYDDISTYIPLYACNSPENNTHYCDLAATKLFDQAAQTADVAKQTQLYKQGLRVFMDDYVVIPLFQFNYVRLVKPYVKNYDIDGNHLDHVQSRWFSLEQH